MVYFFIAEGFEEIEALCPIDILRRTNIEVKTVGIGKNAITGAHGITVVTDMTDSEFSDNAPTLVFLPGGMPGTLNLMANDTVKRAVNIANESGAYIAAICAAPMILGEMGLLYGKEAICYPGFEDKLKGATISDKRVVVDGKIITAAGMGAALDMGIEIVSILRDAKTADDLRRTIIAD